MEIYNYVACKDILGIQTNSKYIGWSFGHPPQSVSEPEIEKCKIVVRFVVDRLKHEAERLHGLEKYHYWRGEPNRDELFYQRVFFAGSKLRLLVRGLQSDKPCVWTNRNYLRFIRFRFNNLHSPGYHLTDLACALLLRKGFSALHCSGFSIGDATVAVVAPPDTGKTLTTMRAVLHSGASFVAEDLAITDGEYFYACPWTSTFRYYDELSMSWLLRMRMKLIKIIPLVELIPMYGDDRKINNYVEEHRIVTNKKITHTAILARRHGGVEVLEKKRALEMLLNLNRYEFMYRKSPMLTAYSYFNPEFDIQALEEREREILTKLTNETTCLLVQSEDPSRFSELILRQIKA